MIFETKRIKLLPLQEKNSRSFHQLCVIPQVRKYLWDDEIISIETAQSHLKDSEKNFRIHKFGIWGIQENSAQGLIGFAGLGFFEGRSDVELLYALDPEFWGRGYATESVLAILKYAFKDLQIPYVIAEIDPPNKASLAVVKRVGMKFWKICKYDDLETHHYKITLDEFTAN